MPQEIEINDKFKEALDAVENTNENLFITGKAGSGKSTLLKYCYSHTSKNVILLAPTGVAALNIQGQTIHRFFGFPINISVAKILNEDFKPRAVRIFKKLETIIIDEASMIRADILDCIDVFLKKYGPVKGKPFGGVQMVFVGDLYQLPPVVGNHEQDFFAKNYTTPYFFSADVIKEINLKVIELSKIYRQKDQDFIDILNNIRNNRADQKDLKALNDRVGAVLKNEGAENFKISLTTTNKAADEVNKKELENLEGSLYKATADVDGSFSAEYFPVAEELNFKVGSQVMFVNNDFKNRWVNGSVGHIENIITKKNGGVRYVEVRLQNDCHLVEVLPYTWEIFKYKLEGNEIISEVAGSYTQYPFRLAWAVTIHKSQGKTFDNVEIDLGRGTFASGQLYVALSRCTSLNGISLKKEIKPHHVLIDERINEFMSNYSDDIILSPVKRNQKLIDAIRKRNKIEIIYKKPDNKKYKRVIVPVNIRDGNMLAFCTLRQEQRTFKLDRILNVRYFDD